jgi:hypothetical protein
MCDGLLANQLGVILNEDKIKNETLGWFDLLIFND